MHCMCTSVFQVYSVRFTEGKTWIRRSGSQNFRKFENDNPSPVLLPTMYPFPLGDRETNRSAQTVETEEGSSG